MFVLRGMAKVMLHMAKFPDCYLLLTKFDGVTFLVK
jgi:hypothetical protein